MSRYIYEHLFLGHLYFDGDPARASVPPRALAHAARHAGRRSIATRRPYDDPGVARFYYRLVPRRRALARQDAHALRAVRPRAWRKFRALFLDRAVHG